MGANLGGRALRIAVKDRKANQAILGTLEKVFCGVMRA
jgi:hypothetical protein